MYQRINALYFALIFSFQKRFMIYFPPQHELMSAAGIILSFSQLFTSVSLSVSLLNDMHSYDLTVLNIVFFYAHAVNLQLFKIYMLGTDDRPQKSLATMSESWRSIFSVSVEEARRCYFDDSMFWKWVGPVVLGSVCASFFSASLQDSRQSRRESLIGVKV